MSERKPLTLEELRKMDGKPAYWFDDDSYGIISVDSSGRWAGVPFFRGRKNGVNFEYNIKSRRIEVYATELPRLDRSAWEKCSACKTEKIIIHVPAFKAMAVFNHHMDHGAFDLTLHLNFCPYCGRPLTDAAWDALENRLEGTE